MVANRRGSLVVRMVAPVEHGNNLKQVPSTRKGLGCLNRMLGNFSCSRDTVASGKGVGTVGLRCATPSWNVTQLEQYSRKEAF